VRAGGFFENFLLGLQAAHLPPSPGQKPGPEGVKPLLQGLIDVFPDFVIMIDDVIGEEHRAATRVSISDTHLGPLMGLPASGKYIYIVAA
jgi:predicted ester cyclase